MPKQIFDPNLLKLHLGQQITITQSTFLVYNQDNKKVIKNRDLKEPYVAYITGMCKKATGTYYPGVNGFALYGQSTAPEFKADKYHWFYLARRTMTGSEFLVHPNAIKK